MQISIALAVYNGDRYLNLLLDSLYRQTVLPFELVIIDDCSTDNSWDIITSITSNKFLVRSYKNEKNEGVNSTFKKLISLCNGDYIAFCDQDDIWLENKLEVSTAKMKELELLYLSKPIAIFTDLTTIDEKGIVLQKSFFDLHKMNPASLFFSNILFDNVITGCTLLINRPLINQLFKMPIEVNMYDYWVALIAYSFGKNGICNFPTVFYRVHNESVTNKAKKNFFSLLLYYFIRHRIEFQKKIKQSILFLNIYRSELESIDIRSLETFIQLQNSSILKQMVVRKITKKFKRII